MTVDFIGWPKTPRLFRDVVVTEKIDGTNACVIVQPYEDARWDVSEYESLVCVDEQWFTVAAQSRKRLICPRADNFGFAAWVQYNAWALAAVLGAGYHYGEWWGHGIQRGYGMVPGERGFALFNADKYGPLLDEARAADIIATYEPLDDEIGVVPVLYRGPFSEDSIQKCLAALREGGSRLGDPAEFKPAEGVVVYHVAAKQVFKVLLDSDDLPKSLVESAGVAA